MEIVDRNPEDVINENLVEQITKEIDKSIIEKIRSNFPYFYWNPENREKYADKFQVIVIDGKPMPYKVQHFIHEQIEKEINQGYIERNKYQKFNLDNIEKVTYIYNPDLCSDQVIRMHKFKEVEEKPTHIKGDFIINNLQTIGNFNNSNKYIIKLYK